MNVVGFDVSKDTLHGARIDRSGVVKEHYQLANTKETIEPVLTELRRRFKRLLVASEATGNYHRALALSCLELGIPFRLLNPLTTKQFIRATVRKKKTDRSDAEVIARIAAQSQGALITKDTFRAAQPVMRTSVKLTQMAQQLALMQQQAKVAYSEELALHKELQACEERLLTAVSVFRSRAAAQVSQQTTKLLQSIPGIGPVTAVTLIAELGDINRFRNAKALVAYAGLDPKVRQSGVSLNRNSRLTKRGSPYLRRVLYLAAASAERTDVDLKATYDKKRAEGKRYTEATLVIARKVLNRAYAVWKRGTPYKIA